MRKVNFLGLCFENVDAAAGVVVSLLEGLKRRCSLAFEAKRGGDFGPVEFQSGGPLGQWLAEAASSLKTVIGRRRKDILLLPFLRAQRQYRGD